VISTVRRGVDEACEAVRAAQRNLGGVVMLLGGSGIGKTTLARHLQGLTPSPAAVAPSASPLQTVATRAEIEPPLGVWTRLAAAAQARHLEVGIGTYRFADALTLLRTIAAHDPRPVLWDDIHAADAESLTLLAHVAPMLPGTGAVLVFTSRGTAATTHSPGGSEVARTAHRAIASHATVISLGPLSIEEVAQALTSRGASLTDATLLAPHYHRASAGTPLILDRVVATTWPMGAPAPAPADIEHASTGSEVTAVWAHELERLTPEDCEVLGLVRELGPHASLALLHGVLTALGRPAGIDALGTLMAHGLIETTAGSDRMALTHPGIAEALDASGHHLSPDAHRALVDCRAGRGGEPRWILSQMTRAADQFTPAERRQVASQVVADAERTGDMRAAAEAWDIVLADPSSTPADRLASAEAWCRAGERTRSRVAAREAAQLLDPHDPDGFARAALIFADGAEFHGEATLAAALLERACELLEPHTDPLSRSRWVEVTATLATVEMTMPMTGPTPSVGVEPAQSGVARMVRWHWVTRPEVAQPRSDTAEEAAQVVGDPVLIATTGLGWRLTHQAPQFAAARRERSERARRTLLAPSQRARAVHAVLLDALEVGEMPAVQIALGELADLAAATGDPAVRWRHAHTASMLERLAGRPEAATHHSEVAAAYGAAAGEPTAVVVRVEQRTVMEVDGLHSDATVRALATDLTSVQHPPLLGGVLWMLGDLHRLGVPGTAIPHPVLEDLLAHLATPRAQEQNWLCSLGFAAGSVATTGDRVLAERALALLDPWGDLVIRESSGVIALGSAHRLRAELLAVCGAHAEAQVAFDAAHAVDDANGFAWAVLAGDLARLRVLAQHGAHPDDELHRSAHALAEQAGARGLRMLAAQARRLGSLTTSWELTDRQRAILSGLAAGHTYQQIADAIGFSHGTVRGEITKLYAVLGVEDRAVAVAEAEWRGLLPAAAFGWDTASAQPSEISR
jgi:DNA-binding CsgD family transcriptional regulator/energy-coupling factor transporter ATP-binding protein EcfA2